MQVRAEGVVQQGQVVAVDLGQIGLELGLVRVLAGVVVVVVVVVAVVVVAAVAVAVAVAAAGTGYT